MHVPCNALYCIYINSSLSADLDSGRGNNNAWLQHVALHWLTACWCPFGISHLPVHLPVQQVEDLEERTEHAEAKARAERQRRVEAEAEAERQRQVAERLQQQLHSLMVAGGNPVSTHRLATVAMA